MPQIDVTSALESPAVRTALVAIGAGLIWVLAREVRKIPAKLLVLMATAFVDMVGLLMIGWSASFTYLMMEKLWDEHRENRASRARARKDER